MQGSSISFSKEQSGFPSYVLDSVGCYDGVGFLVVDGGW